MTKRLEFNSGTYQGDKFYAENHNCWNSGATVNSCNYASWVTLDKAKKVFLLNMEAFKHSAKWEGKHRIRI